MDIQEYIASGIIETYVLGGATPAEEQELLQLAAKYPEVKNELEQVQKALESYALLHAKRPPAFIKDNLMQAIDTQTPANTRGNDSPGSASSYTRITYLRPLAIAASILLVVSIGINAYLYGRLSDAKQEITAMQNQNQQLARENNMQKAGYEQLAHDMEVLRNPDVKMVVMKDPKAANNMMAMVYWNKTNSDTYVSIKNMPSLPRGKQFQLWAIVDGKPVDMGVFDMKTDSLIKCKPTAQAQAFAVTIENEGGSPTPTLEAMVVMGSI